MKTFCKYIGIFAAIFALLCLTGYDCPECNFTAQTIALAVSVSLAIVCGIINDF